jgi:transcriptional regulator NrdR family protein
MLCPDCNSERHAVVATRTVDGEIRRRRQCLNPECNARWTTFETFAQYARVRGRRRFLYPAAPYAS